MSEKIDKSTIENILGKIVKPKENDNDKLYELLNNMQSKGSDNNSFLSMLPLFLNSKGNGGIDRLYDLIALQSAMNMMKPPEKNNKEDILEREIREMKEEFKNELRELKETKNNNNSDTNSEILKVLLQSLIGNSGKNDNELLKILIPVLKSDNKDPIDILKNYAELISGNNDKVDKLKDEMHQRELEKLKEHNEETQKMLTEVVRKINENKGDAEWMEKLQQSTETLNKFSEMTKKMGLMPAPSEKGKVDLKYILDTVSNIVSNTVPALKPPERNNLWDVDREAERLYNRYKDDIVDTNNKPITKEFVKQALIQNPKLDEQWDAMIKARDYELNKTQKTFDDIPSEETLEDDVEENNDEEEENIIDENETTFLTDVKEEAKREVKEEKIPPKQPEEKKEKKELKGNFTAGIKM
ncbi:hypothetical protein [Mycobacterium sp.]|uniref:hypothetical protein n=1 Tax=Mycobacterium sp. TaxID=1785 RepID=UPI0031D5CE85